MPARKKSSDAAPKGKAPRPASAAATQNYAHPMADSPMRPDIGTQAQFRKKKAPATYRYDSSLSPALDWDGQNPARDAGEALIAQIRNATSLEEAKAAADKLAALGRPFLNWTGTAERHSFEVNVKHNDDGDMTRVPEMAQAERQIQ